MELGKSFWKTFERGIEREWLLTNGIGGYAASTVIGANTRRYHGLLIASLKPPVNRHLILSKIDESVVLNGTAHHIYSFQTPDYVMEGFRYQQRFLREPVPTFIYSVEDVFIEKRICMVHGENTVAVVYRIINGSSPSVLRLTPLVNFRDHHYNAAREYMQFEQKASGKGISIKPYGQDIDISIECSHGSYTRTDNTYFLNMDYAVEKERGLHPTEDHFIPGYFEVEAAPGEEKIITITATTEKGKIHGDGPEIIEAEEQRLKKLVNRSGLKEPFARKLVLAADKFIVERASTRSKTIIAGYPWFTDWGRDTMIALPGLTLATGRFDDARDILFTFSKYVKYGLIPNMFPDGGEEPPYNTVDASLWFFEAVGKYLKYTGDYEFIEKYIFGALTQIIDAYRGGTLFKIGMDADYLITAGDESTQLTWMDAKVGSWVVTPRHGKAVEINALWYNALKVYSGLLKHLGKDSSSFESLSDKVRESFAEAFWNDAGQCLYDVITGSFRDASVRCNQILAVSLTNAVIEGEKAARVVTRVWKELYTAYGLRSLSPEEKGYVGIYTGDQLRRDGAYHQGTVWTWPLGHFITAFVKVHGNTDHAKNRALKFIEPFKDHLEDACMGSISEIFNGSEPHEAKGCFAQAWSVGEVLRAYVEDVL